MYRILVCMLIYNFVYCMYIIICIYYYICIYCYRLLLSMLKDCYSQTDTDVYIIYIYIILSPIQYTNGSYTICLCHIPLLFTITQSSVIVLIGLNIKWWTKPEKIGQLHFRTRIFEQIEQNKIKESCELVES